jgi:hypothetical protein
MGYKALGFIVWQGGKWYLRRRYGSSARKIGLGTLIVGGVVAALIVQRRFNGS